MPITLPNFDRVQHASVRVKVDPKYVALQRNLDEAWYGDKDESGRSDRSTGAKVGVPDRMWEGVAITSEDQFNRLSALIEAHRMVELVEQNDADGRPYPDLSMRPQSGRDGEADFVLDVKAGHLDRINTERAAGLDIDAVIAQTRNA